MSKQHVGILVAVLALGCGDSADDGSAASGGGSTSSSSVGGGGVGGGGEGGGAANQCSDGVRAPVEGTGCAAFADGACQRFERCAPDVLLLLWGNAEGCRAEQELLCAQNLARPGDPTSIEGWASCAELVVGGSCDCDYASICAVDAGTLGDGSRCSSGTQCASGYCRGATPYAECGTCVAKAGAGESCSNRPCVDGLVCGPGNTCQEGLADGATCTSNSECLSRSCNGGSCGPMRQAGQSCGPSQGICDSSSATFCEAGVCTPFPIGTEDGACGGEDVVFCPSHRVCSVPLSPASPAPEGTCIARRGEGQSCSARPYEIIDSDCALGLRCILGSCQVPTPRACPAD